jgi:hypothetical protein
LCINVSEEHAASIFKDKVRKVRKLKGYSVRWRIESGSTGRWANHSYGRGKGGGDKSGSVGARNGKVPLSGPQRGRLERKGKLALFRSPRKEVE